jgi:hypothetical protein
MKMSEKVMQEELMPLELQLDLLVDEELPEERRAAVLREIERMPGTWRKLAVRFLERQVERRAARQLIAGGSLVVHEPVGRVYRFPGALRRLVSRGRLLAVAASLLIAAVSATVTWYAVGRSVNRVAPAELAVTRVNVPGRALGMDKAMPVDVPVVSSRNESTGDSLFLETPGEDAGTPRRRSLIIQSDGNGKALVVPVNTLTNVSWQ